MCCGKMSTRLQTNNQLATPGVPMRVSPQGGTTFEYVGRTGATVVGPVSGVTYRFSGAGSRRRVDPRDRPGLARVPVLKHVF